MENVRFQSGSAIIGGALYRPEGEGPWPGVVVIHENRGLTDYIQETARQLAGEGYVTLAVNLCSRKLDPAAPGGTDEAMAALRELTTEEAMQDLGAAVDFLKSRQEVRPEAVGCVGFCYGGRLSLLLACHRPDVRASVVFYGRTADALPLIPNLRAAVLGNFGEADGGIPAESVRELEAALKASGKSCDIKLYPGAGHAFHRPGGANHHEEAARDAWNRTVGWFDRHLKG